MTFTIRFLSSWVSFPAQASGNHSGGRATERRLAHAAVAGRAARRRMAARCIPLCPSGDTPLNKLSVPGAGLCRMILLSVITVAAVGPGNTRTHTARFAASLKILLIVYM